MEKKVIKVALAGNPNSGKSTIFNALTGGHAHVGNWPGVTVERKDGTFRYRDYEVIVTDLPGTYSLTAFSIDERIARDFILKEKPDVVVCVADATNLLRSLYLFVLLRELGANAILDLNMGDLIEGKIKVDIEGMEKALGAPVVITSGIKGTGINELKEEIVKAKDREVAPFRINYGDIEEAIRKLEDKLSGYSLPYDKRFLALKLLEGDPIFKEELRSLGYEEIVELAEKEALTFEQKFGYDLETAIIEKRYGYIDAIVRKYTQRIAPIEEKLSISDKIDKIVINKYLGIPIFALFMWITFELTFRIGGFFSDYIDSFFSGLGGILENYLTSINAPVPLISFIKDGIIGGLGSVIVFLPNILVLFLFLSFLEDVGYMARAAFVVDKAMYTIGLPGRSFIPMILGFGCNVPAIMSTRTIPEERDRILTILINPFMSCTARLPIYVLFTGIFFEKNQGLIILSLYALGIFVAIFSAKIFRTIIPSLKGPISPLIMELPPYRLPTLKGVWIHAWERSREFLKKAGTIIFLGVVLIWFLASVPFSSEYGSEESIIGRLGKIIAPLLGPAGFPYWQIAVALLFGILAKEVVIGTLGTLFGGEENLAKALQNLFTPLSAYSFMIMSLLYMPCLATIGVIKRETNWKWALFSVFYSILVGWTISVLFYQIGRVFAK
ncbi:ferrous iron transport protein B [Dictyoglomus sp.]|uniref:ferrous iron transport protein B n=1 Tax=Dictyoglomus sp. TaxID=28205 RepID=UPI003D0CF204